jgi:hypothetical protein
VKLTSIFAALVLTACSYGLVQDHTTVQNVALKPDGSLVAVMVKYERYRPATGLAAFPDGGVPRMLLQRADLYIVSLDRRALIYRRELPHERDQTVSFEPRLVGWAGDTVYMQITGCPGDPGDECYGRLKRKALYSWSPGSSVAEASSAAGAVLMSSLRTPQRFVSIGTEPYGVSIGTQMRAQRTPLLHFTGTQLEIVR